MNKSAFLKLIKQVSDISDQQQSELEQVAATFPYCQTAHLLLAKSAYDKGSMLSTQRLRRASAYATDRQLLKRLIYASPVLEPAYADHADAAEEETTAALPIPADTQEIEKTPAAATEITELEVTDTLEEEVIPETEQEAEPLEEVYSHTSAENARYTEQESEADDDSESPEAEIDSELALLFTFSSIGTSSTDLISRREEPAGIEEHVDNDADSSQFAETAEALHNLEEEADVAQHELTTEVVTEDSAPEFEQYEADHTIPEIEKSEPVEGPVSSMEADDSAEPASGIAADDAEINYSFDEIDRLYAEDALGYWMGSSRMGEVLQLKDDYTRLRPQSFHPELILEYSRTHELEKAVQPTRHVLSKQLDIIDQFLKLNPKLKTVANLKLKPEPQEDLSLKSSKIKKGMASESLANIFIKQGKTKKAVKIYEQLILKYPEKKSYFAEQIEKLQNIT